MNNKNKSYSAYKTISEAANEVGLVDKKTGRSQTHTLRYWESQFKQIKPFVGAGNRRYYSNDIIKIIKYVKILLKEKGLTINGVKKILNTKKYDTLDDDMILGINRSDIYRGKRIKDKINNIYKIIKELKKIKNG